MARDAPTGQRIYTDRRAAQRVTTDIFSSCSPRRDVLDGVLSDAIFAASLDDVVTGTAPDVYRDADTFFAATHPSEGLRDLLVTALGRLTGARPDAPPVIRLETNLGGGKTHNLIALWHAAKGGLNPMQALSYVPIDLLPHQPVRQLATFVGTSAGATSFPQVEGVATSTVWHYLAAQIAGAEGVALVSQGELLTAPGADALKRLIGDAPTLILIDEIARYLATAAGQKVGESTLARQTVSFLMALMEAVDAKSNAVLVVTTTDVTDAFGDETQAVLDALTEARSLMARREHVLRPSGEADLPRILTRRLFEQVDESQGAAVGAAYALAAGDAYGRGADLATELTAGTWAEEVARSYPFHPALIRVLDKRLSTIPNFQRTRGALRLLAGAVRCLWDEKPSDTLLIHPHHLDLRDRHTVEDLSSRLGLGAFEPVVRADIAGQERGERAHAEELDDRLGAPFGRRLATTAYLYSLTNEVPGIAAPDLIGAVVAPTDDHNLIARALDGLEQTCWYLHVDERGYRFSTEASLVMLLQDAQSRIPVGKVRTEATSILARQFRDAALKVRRTWEDSRVPDREDEAALVVLHWDDFGDRRGVDPGGPTPDRVVELWEKTPAGGLRQFRNRLVLLAPSSGGTHEAMLDAVRQHLALDALSNDTDTLRRLSEAKRSELKQRAGESDLLARVAVCNHVNILYVPQAGGLEAVELSTVTQASVKPNQSDAIIDRLASMEKTLAAGDPPLDPHLVKSRLGAMLDRPLTTADLVRAFAQRSDMKLVLDKAQLVTLVRSGVTGGVWEYHDETQGEAGWATRERTPGMIRLGDDTVLHPVGTAPPPPQVACPLCGQVHTGACPTGGGPGPGLVAPPVSPTTFKGSGAAVAAFATALQEAADADRSAISSLTITIDELGKDTHQQLARLHSVVPANTPGASITYRISLHAVLDQPEHTVRLDFVGPAADWAALKPSVDQVLRTRQATLQALLEARFDDPVALGSDVVAGITQRATDTGPARCIVTIVTEDRQ
jgi:hypothetical protein